MSEVVTFFTLVLLDGEFGVDVVPLVIDVVTLVAVLVVVVVVAEVLVVCFVVLETGK